MKAKTVIKLLEQGEKIFYVDLPNINATSDDDAWENYDTYFSRQEAEKVLQDKWGIEKKYADLFIEQGEA